jgi:hypothetical protein
MRNIGPLTFALVDSNMRITPTIGSGLSITPTAVGNNCPMTSPIGDSF